MDKPIIRATVLETLTRIAPETQPETLVANKELRDQVDLDSMDFLNFLVGLHKKFSVDIPESDYAQLITLDSIVNYLASKIN